MEMQGLPFASLNPHLVEKVKRLEQELQAETKEEIILLAYQQDGETRASR